MPENLKKYRDQIGALWRQLGINQKISLILAFGGVLAGLMVLAFWSSRPQMRLLFGGLDAADMSDVVATLEEQGLEYELRGNGGSVYVPTDEVHKLRMEMASKGVPSGGGVGFEIFDRGNFGISDFVQRTNYMRAVQGELSRTIAQVKGVRSARVMVVQPESRLLLAREGVRPTASVFVDTGGAQMAAETVNAIRFLVANSVEGLGVNDVAVVDNHGNMVSSAVQEDQMMGVATSAFKYRRAVEDYFTAKVESMLNRVVGPGNAVARVSVSIDSQTRTQRDELFDPESQVIRQQTVSEDSSASTDSEGATVAGVSANVANEPGEQMGDGQMSQSEESRSSRSTTYEINRSMVETVTAPGSIRQVSAAIFLATRFEETSDGLEPLPRSSEELEKIQRMVIHALGIDGEGNRTGTQLVTVEEMPFEGQSAWSGDSTAGGISGDLVFVIIDGLRRFAAVAIAIVIFVVFLRLLKKQKPSSLAVEVVDEPSADDVLKDVNRSSQNLTPDLLNELIRQKPANVSTALRSWVSAGKQ